MKSILQCTIALLALVLTTSPLQSQDLSTPVGYMDGFSQAHQAMSKTYMEYTSAVSHGKRARKVEKLRLKVLETINDTRNATYGLGAFKGDNSLRQASVDYIKLCYHVFNDDYAKIVNMEEIAEQSVDKMEAYLLLQEATEKKLQDASEKMQLAQKAFAAKYNINLVETKSELGNKLETAGKLNRYRNQVYMLFFKCNWQDGMITQALNNKKVNDIEQARNALIKYANDGLAALDTLKSFNGDASLANMCRQTLNFYKKTAETDLSKLTDFLLKQENFEKMKKSFEQMPDSKRTKADIDNFNKAVNELNAAVGTFNQTNEKINKARHQAIDTWTKTEKDFLDRNMPHYKS